MAKRTAGPRCRRADGLKQMYFTGSLQCASGAKRDFRLSASREVRRKKTYCRTTIPAGSCPLCAVPVPRVATGGVHDPRIGQGDMSECAGCWSWLVRGVVCGLSVLNIGSTVPCPNSPLCEVLSESAPCPCHMPSQIEALQLLSVLQRSMMIALASSF